MSRRLLLGMLAFAAAILTLLIVPLGVANQRSERADLTRRLERDAVAAASLATDLLDGVDAAGDATLRTRLDEYASDSDARIVIVDASGRSIVDTGEAEANAELGRDFTTRPEVEGALDGRVASGERSSRTLGHRLLYVAVPVASGGRVLGAARISYPADELDRRVQNYWYGLGAVALAAMAVAALLAAVLARWIARPLESIGQVAGDVGAGALDARADETAGPPEVRAVARRLNASLDSVEQSLADQRAFTADASHQLRTPLHAMTLRLDNVRHAIEAGEASAATTDIDHAAAEVERLASLVESMLVLERADREAAGALEPVVAADVVAARIDAWRERAARTDVAIEARIAPELVVLARAVHVEQVLDNYVDNAITVTPAGGTVRLDARVVDDGAAVELHVVDEGSGLSDDELDGAFRRFHSSAARPRPRGAGGGFGLGLSIVRRLAELDGGAAWLRHGPGRGVDAVVRYPSASQAAASSDA